MVVVDRLSKVLEQYLRCFVADESKLWLKFLSLAEFGYNTAFQTATAMTSFEAVYGRKPPPLLDYIMGTSHKLAKRYYGLFQVNRRIGKEAYRLDLPSTSRVHLVFHVSLLKPCWGDPPSEPPDLPIDLADGGFPSLTPLKVLQRQTLRRGNHFPTEGLIQWTDLPASDAMWEDDVALYRAFPWRSLADRRRSGDLPEDPLLRDCPAMTPAEILTDHTRRSGSGFVKEIRVLWNKLRADATTWKDLVACRRSFPAFDLEDKVNVKGGGNVVNPNSADGRVKYKRVWMKEAEPTEPNNNQNTNEELTQQIHANKRPKTNIRRPKHLKNFYTSKQWISITPRQQQRSSIAARHQRKH